MSVSSPKPAELGEALRFSGSVVALRDANVSVRVDGLVEEIIVDAGVRVEKGPATAAPGRGIGSPAVQAGTGYARAS